jgi:hypothetical protein
MHNTVIESYIAKNVLGIEDCCLLGIPNLLPATIESPSIDKLTEEGYINGRFSGVLSPTAHCESLFTKGFSDGVTRPKLEAE